MRKIPQGAEGTSKTCRVLLQVLKLFLLLQLRTSWLVKLISWTSHCQPSYAFPNPYCWEIWLKVGVTAESVFLDFKYNRHFFSPRSNPFPVCFTWAYGKIKLWNSTLKSISCANNNFRTFPFALREGLADTMK